MSTVIEKLLNEMQEGGGSTRTLVAYFYFKHGQKDKNNHNDFLRALLAQLLDRNIAMPEQLYNDLSSAAEEKLRSTESLEARIKEAFECFESIFLVVDGLDACEREEAGCTVEWLLSLVNDGSETSNTSLRFIFSGQRDGVLDKILANQPSIALESSQQHLEDIIQYCQTFVRENQRKARFQIDPELENEIVTLVTEEAKGNLELYLEITHSLTSYRDVFVRSSRSGKPPASNLDRSAKTRASTWDISARTRGSVRSGDKSLLTQLA